MTWLKGKQFPEEKLRKHKFCRWWSEVFCLSEESCESRKHAFRPGCFRMPSMADQSSQKPCKTPGSCEGFWPFFHTPKSVSTWTFKFVSPEMKSISDDNCDIKIFKSHSQTFVLWLGSPSFKKKIKAWSPSNNETIELWDLRMSVVGWITGLKQNQS